MVQSRFSSVSGWQSIAITADTRLWTRYFRSKTSERWIWRTQFPSIFSAFHRHSTSFVCLVIFATLSLLRNISNCYFVQVGKDSDFDALRFEAVRSLVEFAGGDALQCSQLIASGACEFLRFWIVDAGPGVSFLHGPFFQPNSISLVMKCSYRRKTNWQSYNVGVLDSRKTKLRPDSLQSSMFPV